MAQLIQIIYDGYRDLMDNKSDPRVNGWVMMSSPFPTLAICLFYAYFVKILGPKLMENRKPFDLRRVMIWYNLFQVIFSSWLFNEVSICIYIIGHEGNSSRYFVSFISSFRRVWFPVGVDNIPSDVNRSITRTVQLQCEWREVAGGTTSPSLSNSQTRFSSY